MASSDFDWSDTVGEHPSRRRTRVKRSPVNYTSMRATTCQSSRAKRKLTRLFVCLSVAAAGESLFSEFMQELIACRRGRRGRLHNGRCPVTLRPCGQLVDEINSRHESIKRSCSSVQFQSMKNTQRINIMKKTSANMKKYQLFDSSAVFKMNVTEMEYIIRPNAE